MLSRHSFRDLLITKHLTALLLFLLAACNNRSPIPEVFDESVGVIEISDLYQAGQYQFEKGIAALPDLRQVWQNSRNRVLLIMMTVAYDDGEYEQVQQSGIFVDNGHFILTSGHGFFIDEGHIIDVRGQTISGHKLNLELVSLAYEKDQGQIEDWAILKPAIRFLSRGIKIAAPDSYQKDVLVLGFPGSMGIDEAGQVVHIHEVERGAIYPLGITCERTLLKQRILRPRAGAIPIRGMSGGPVLDQSGELIGLFSSVSRTRSISGWHYILGMSDIPIRTLDSLIAK